jgi:hypothetical protein
MTGEESHTVLFLLLRGVLFLHEAAVVTFVLGRLLRWRSCHPVSHQPSAERAPQSWGGMKLEGIGESWRRTPAPGATASSYWLRRGAGTCQRFLLDARAKRSRKPVLSTVWQSGEERRDDELIKRFLAHRGWNVAARRLSCGGGTRRVPFIEYERSRGKRKE